jgi:hypothetical protein
VWKGDINNNTCYQKPVKFISETFLRKIGKGSSVKLQKNSYSGYKAPVEEDTDVTLNFT